MIRTSGKRVGAAIILLACLAVNTTAAGQSARLTMQGQAENLDLATIRDNLGRRCLDVEAAARGRVVDPKILDHLVSIKSNCNRSLKLKVCYFNSDKCQAVDLQPYKRVDTILGSARGISFFRYTIVLR